MDGFISDLSRSPPPDSEATDAVRQLTILRSVLRSVEGENARLRTQGKPAPVVPLPARRLVINGAPPVTPLGARALQQLGRRTSHPGLEPRNEPIAATPAYPAPRSGRGAYVGGGRVSQDAALLSHGNEAGDRLAADAGPPPLTPSAGLSQHSLSPLSRVAALEAALRGSEADASLLRAEQAACAAEAAALRGRVAAAAEAAAAWRVRAEEEAAAAAAWQAQVEELQVSNGEGIPSCLLP